MIMIEVAIRLDKDKGDQSFISGKFYEITEESPPFTLKSKERHVNGTLEILNQRTQWWTPVKQLHSTGLARRSCGSLPLECSPK